MENKIDFILEMQELPDEKIIDRLTEIQDTTEKGALLMPLIHAYNMGLIEGKRQERSRNEKQYIKKWMELPEAAKEEAAERVERHIEKIIAGWNGKTSYTIYHELQPEGMKIELLFDTPEQFLKKGSRILSPGIAIKKPEWLYLRTTSEKWEEGEDCQKITFQLIPGRPTA